MLKQRSNHVEIQFVYSLTRSLPIYFCPVLMMLFLFFILLTALRGICINVFLRDLVFGLETQSTAMLGATFISCIGDERHIMRRDTVID